ncbi:MAG: 3',5'-cyclic-AMP phosphodiesterase [Gammaproteobacteria bacterium]|nr:3',5'-cyclic-AMP phosphodiesterase [Gammaproteobacteria bacterium]
MSYTGRTPAVSDRFSGCPADSVRVLQFTDTHLYRDADRTLLGLNTQQSFEEVLVRARAQHWPADLVLATGDLVHDHSLEGYQRLRETLATLGVPGYWLPGNHDDPRLMRAALQRSGASDPRSVRVKGWQIILLDSHLEGSDAGRVAPAELERLEEDLERFSDHHALVCLHHPPVLIGSRWMDAIGLQNAEELLALLDRHRQVRAVLWGHIHQEFLGERRGMLLLGTPSTCFQFKPNRADFEVDSEPPGYRWLVLHADGRVETGVERLADFPVEINMASTGY